MGLMVERSCAVVEIDGTGFLCLLCAEPALPTTAPFPRSAPFRSPLEGTSMVAVLPGGLAEDFRWASAGRDRIVAPAPLPQAGVAAAVTALLYGLVPGAGQFLGSDVARPAIHLFTPPGDEWWSGEWRAGPATGPPARYHARMLMHGEMVGRGSAFPPASTMI